jgi:hypothetical protein
MTLLGKWLVFVNLLLSFLLLSWAFGIYTNRIDWSAADAKGDKPPGALKVRQDRIKSATNSLTIAADRWREALKGFPGSETRARHAGLIDWENRVAGDRVWYAAQLKEAKAGPDGKGEKKPIKAVKLGPDGVPVPDPNNADRPTLVDAERRRLDKPEDAARPLYNSDWYAKELTRLAQLSEAAQTDYIEQVNLARELTEKAIGPKGLRQAIIDEQIKGARIKDEMLDVTGRQTNAEVETELLQSRRDQLERRVEELKKGREDKK